MQITAATGERIRFWMEKRQETPTRLAKKSGLSRPVIVRLAKGQRPPRMEHLEKLAKALHCSPRDLMPADLANAPIEQASSAELPSGSDLSATLPPNVGDFIQRMERERRYEADVLQVMRDRFRWPELQYATESELLEFADRCRGFVERARAWRAARGTGGGEHS